MSTSLAVALAMTACGGGADDRRKCTNNTDCADDESCEAGVCLPACTPGVDCPEKDGSSGDGADGDAIEGDVSADGDGAADASGDVSDDVSEDADGDVGPDVTLLEEVACELERNLLTYSDGSAFEVKFGEKSTGIVALPEGWSVDPVCCTAGCCQ